MKVIIADDHRLFRDGLRLQLQLFDPSLEVAEAGSFPDLLALLERSGGFDLMLVDLGMPGLPWRDVLRRIVAEHPQASIVVVSASDEQRDILDVLDIGASGFIPKTSSGEVMINALRLVLAGGIYLPKELLAKVGRRESEPAAPDSAVDDRESEAVLTPRQLEVLRLMAEGRSNKEIADRLGVSDGTIKSHTSAILRALEVPNRTKAILVASRMGILPPL